MENKSHLTAISRNVISAPMAILECELDKKDMLDYGCGKGFDADHFEMEKYDPHFFPEKPEGKFDIITCNYVLCVVSEEEQQAVIDDVMSMLKPGGKAYFTVRRDKKNLNGWTKRQTFQRYVELDMDIYHEESGRYCIYEKQQKEGMLCTKVKFTLLVPEAEKKGVEFANGLGAGVIYSEVAEFYQTEEESLRPTMLAMGVMAHAENIEARMIKMNAEVVE